MLIFSHLVNFGHNFPSSLLRWQNGLGIAWPGREPEVQTNLSIKQHSLTIPGATQKFTGLQQLSETYTRTPESKYINVQHFMRGLQDKMTNDQDFVQSVLRNGSRSYQKINLILEGKSIL